GPASPPTPSRAWRPTCVSRVPRRWRPRSSARAPRGRTGSSNGRTRWATRVRSPSTENPSAPASPGRAPEDLMSNVDLSSKIPNNVDLGQDKRLLRALEQWQPNYLGWWREMGPTHFQERDVW